MPTLLNFGDHYPDGGWGWVVCGAVFVVHFLALGFVYSYGSLHYLLVEKHQQLEQHSGKYDKQLMNEQMVVNIPGC